MHGGTVGTDPVAGQPQRGRRRGQPAAAVPILQVGKQKWHRCRALLGRLAALRQQGRLRAGDLAVWQAYTEKHWCTDQANPDRSFPLFYYRSKAQLEGDRDSMVVDAVLPAAPGASSTAGSVQSPAEGISGNQASSNASRTKLISYEEIAKHNRNGDCWIVVNCKVYDVTSFIADHPGGSDVILSSAGADSTVEFLDAHPESIIKVALGAAGVASSFIGHADPSTAPAKSTGEMQLGHCLMTGAAMFLVAIVVGVGTKR